MAGGPEEGAAMTRSEIRRAAVTIALLALVAAAGPAGAQVLGRPADGDLRLEWTAAEDRRGRPIVSGYIYNLRGGTYATSVRLLVDGARQRDRLRADRGRGGRDHGPSRGRGPSPAMITAPGGPLRHPAFWLLAINVAALIVFLNGPMAEKYPLAALGILAFSFVQIAFPACR